MLDQDEVSAILADARVNIELVPTMDMDGNLLWTCRLRDYGNGAKKDQMILTGGETVDEALRYAAMAWLDASYIALDWRARATVPGICTESTYAVKPTFDAAEARKQLQARYGTGKGIHASNGAKELPRASQRQK